MAEQTGYGKGRGPVLKPDKLPPELQKVLAEVREKFDAAERIHKAYRDKWRSYYDLYRSYNRLKRRVRGTERDRDATILEAKRDWGAELFIPYAFATVETVLPRILATDPTMVVRPRNPNARESALRTKELLEAQQAEINYHLKLQPTAKRGLMFGLGVQKTFWERKTRMVMRTVPSMNNPMEYAAVEMPQVLHEGPQVEDVDIFHFFWDPMAKDIESAEWVIHRVYRSYNYVKKKIESGEWLNYDCEKDIKGKGIAKDLTELQTEKLEAAGVDKFDPQAQLKQADGGLHEVLEFHDRENVYTVLDRRIVVQAEKTPFYHRELPFQIYRPTMVPGEFVGVGEIEPIVHLQHELNTLRSQRRNNATIVLQKAFAYSNGVINPNDLVIGPGVAIPVQGLPRDHLMPIEVGEIPGSSYQEENVLKEDIERTTGVSDALAGGTAAGTPGSDTATGIQLIQQAAGFRIQLKTKNLERELVKPAARQFLELNRQHMLTPQAVRVEDPETPEGFRFTEVGPEHINDDIDEPIPEGGSTEPDNPQLRQETALRLFNQLGSLPIVDPRRLALYLMKEFDVPDPEDMLVPETPQVDPRLMGEVLAELGVDNETIMQAVELTLQAQQDAEATARGDSTQTGLEPPEPDDNQEA